ncbi:ABC transporter substrate-binding protein [Streptacidiphilus jiangxiensis]|uniref:Osmoprotectant transport system substrate-binding protein n=1 Tax=Streptacidiphilus jiangxiensis TaxID=235985 RepID=A0A1H7K193_STRJI|nr:ABC transporter substrate-binding protein [Streptacidiphilus jiangxiensis]SEK79727.1 osmoprotectant transport system substrate-binding protein [Streptacidiphilus jiangxiensis]
MTSFNVSRSTRTRAAAALVASAAAVALSACGSSSSSSTGSNPLAPTAAAAGGAITVGSNNFAESTILADIYGHALAAKGFQVKYHANIGSREISYGLMKNGLVTVMPEYNGALLSYLDPTAVPTSTADTDTKASAKLAGVLQLLNPSMAEDKDSLTVNSNTAKQYTLTSSSTISSLPPKVAASLVIGAAPEFQTREQGLVGLKDKYGLQFKSFKALDPGGTLTKTALQGNDVQIADIFTTDPSIQKNGWVTLLDDKGLFGFQNVVPLANKSLPAGAATVLNDVSAKLTTAGLMALNAQVGLQGADPAQVADQWLKANGLS